MERVVHEYRFCLISFFVFNKSKSSDGNQINILHTLAKTPPILMFTRCMPSGRCETIYCLIISSVFSFSMKLFVYRCIRKRKYAKQMIILNVGIFKLGQNCRIVLCTKTTYDCLTWGSHQSSSQKDKVQSRWILKDLSGIWAANTPTTNISKSPVQSCNLYDFGQQAMKKQAGISRIYMRMK